MQSTIIETPAISGHSRTRALAGRAAFLDGPGRFTIRTHAFREPGPTEVLVRMEGCGVCGSNLAPWQGRDWFNYPFEAGAPGHEGWGVVEIAGSHVTTVQPGDRVATLSYNAFAEFSLAEATRVVPLPEELGNQPFPGEALGCAFNVFRRCEIQAGQTVAIVGIGFLGAVLTTLAAQAGAHVIAITRRPFALETARHFGARDAVPMLDHGMVVSAVKELTEGAGCDRVIEAVGAQWPLDLASEITRERGRLIVAGYHQDGPRQVNMQLWNWRGIDVINAHERDPGIYIQGIREAAEAVASGKLNPMPLYTHYYPLERIADAFTAMESRPDRFMKALITT